MSLQSIEEKLDRLLRHLGVEGATSPAPPPQDTEAIEKHAQKVREAREEQLKRLFKEENSDELNPEGKRFVAEGWMDA
jgi:ribosomal protein L12E/L44/L45/RPP1/RPP2